MKKPPACSFIKKDFDTFEKFEKIYKASIHVYNSAYNSNCRNIFKLQTLK